MTDGPLNALSHASTYPTPPSRPWDSPHGRKGWSAEQTQLPRIAASPRTGAEREEIKTINNQETHPNASNAVLPVEVLSILEPADGGHGVACSWTAELDGVPSRHRMQFLLHALGVRPVGC